MCVDFSPFDVQTSVLKGVILVQHMVWNTSECVPHEPDKWTLSLEIWMKFTLSFCHIMSHDRMDLSFKWRILQCFEKKHVSKLFILNNYVKKLCGVQGNLYRVVRHKNMCNVLYLIATDTTLIKSNDASKSKLSLLWNWFFSPFQGSWPTRLVAPWCSTTPGRTSSSTSPTRARRRSPQWDGE